MEVNHLAFILLLCNFICIEPCVKLALIVV